MSRSIRSIVPYAVSKAKRLGSGGATNITLTSFVRNITYLWNNLSAAASHTLVLKVISGTVTVNRVLAI